MEQGTKEQVSGAPSFSISLICLFRHVFEPREKNDHNPSKISLFRVAHFGEVRSRDIFHLFFPSFRGDAQKEPHFAFPRTFFPEEMETNAETAIDQAFYWLLLGRNVRRNGLVRVKTRGGEIVPKNWGFDK